MVMNGFSKLFKTQSGTARQETKVLQKGDSLFHQNDKVENIYLITLGKIKLVRNTQDGTPVVLHVGQEGETIAEASLFSDYYHCSAIAETDSAVIQMKKMEIVKYLQEKPEEMTHLVAIFARQVRDLRAINEIKNIRSAGDRILAFVRCNMDENNKMTLDASLKDIAYKIGLAHETFYRELKKLETAGKIKRTDDMIQIIQH